MLEFNLASRQWTKRLGLLVGWYVYTFFVLLRNDDAWWVSRSNRSAPRTCTSVSQRTGPFVLEDLSKEILLSCYWWLMSSWACVSTHRHIQKSSVLPKCLTQFSFEQCQGRSSLDQPLLQTCFSFSFYCYYAGSWIRWTGCPTWHIPCTHM